MTRAEAVPGGRTQIRHGVASLGAPRLIALAALLVVGAVAVLGPGLTPHDPSLTVAAPFDPASGQYPLGTDFLGRDVLSRVLAGGRSVALYATVATVLAYAGGIVVGIAAGYLGGWVDQLLMRGVDIMLAFPTIVFVLLLGAVAGNGIGPVVAATAIIELPAVARVVRTATLEQSVRGFVEAAVARGETSLSVMRREILPNISRPIWAGVGLRFTWCVLLIASVNFLGLGLQPPAADWGLMISENRSGIASNPWAMLAPAAFLGALTIAISVASDSVGRRTAA